MELSKEFEKQVKDALSCTKYDDQTETGGVYYDNTVEEFALQMVGSYANSVERLLKDRQTELINDKPNATSSEEQVQYDLLIVELALILKQLETLKP